MVGVLALALLARSRSLEQETVGIYHVVDDAALADLLALELTLSRQVLAVVVAEVVVGGDGEGLDTSVDEELGEDGLELGLAGLEVITTDEGLLALGELDGTRDKGVLGSTVDEGLVLEDGGDSEDGGGGNLRVGVLDGVQEVIGGVVDARDDIGVALGVGGPEDDNTVELVVLLELPDIGTNLIKVSLLIFAREQVVGTSFLVGSDEVGVVDGGEGLPEEGHVRSDLALEVVVEDLGAAHGLVHGDAGDIPTAQDEVIGVHHGQKVGDGDMDILTVGVGAQAEGRGAKEGANVVRGLKAFLGVPGDLVTVGENGRTESGAIVTTNTDHHETETIVSTERKIGKIERYSPSLGDLALGLEFEFLRDRGNDVLSIDDVDLGTSVDELGGDVVVGEGDILRLDGDSMRATRAGGVNRHDGLELRVRGVVTRSGHGYNNREVERRWCRAGNLELNYEARGRMLRASMLVVR